MPKKLAPLLAAVVYVLFGGAVWAQDSPKTVSACDLTNDPKSFDGRMIHLRATVNAYFENFSLDTSGCATASSVWLTFGGDVPGIVLSTTNDNLRIPGKDVLVNGLAYGIERDDNFRKFYALIAAEHAGKPAYRVTATIAGTFLAGEERKLPGGQTVFSGYGHLGCCSLFVITQISEVQSVPPAALDIRGTVLAPDGKPAVGFVVFDDVRGGAPPQRQQAVTNEKGEFHFSNSGQVLRFEDTRYRPVAVFVEPGGRNIRVKLEEAGRSDWVVPPCKQKDDSATQTGFSIFFELPQFLASRRVDFDDENLHTYLVFARGEDESTAELTITKDNERSAGDNTAVGSGRPEQRWIKDSAGAVIGIDSRDFSGGWHRRDALFWGADTAAYMSRSRRKISSFDGVIDSACVAAR